MIQELYDIYRSSTGVTTDTRTISAGKVFFALKGDRFDGNSYAAKAIELGASHVVVDDEQYYIEGGKCTLVEDVLSTLQMIATHHRLQLGTKVIGLTGSNGKTTSKELLVAVLSMKYKVAATKGNFNNHIGVPLTLLDIEPEHEIAVVEMGANHVGEIRNLCSICLPDEGFITNIGKAHLEGFGGVEGIKQGKSELYRHLANTGGRIYYDSEDTVLMSLLPQEGPEKEDINNVPANIADDFPVLAVKYRSSRIESKLTGGYNLKNIHYAIAIGEEYGIEESAIVKAIEAYTPVNNRSQILKKGANTYILDSYNANPTSMKLSIENILQVAAHKRVLVIGDMKEMGKYEHDEHTSILQYISSFDWKAVYTVGEAFLKCSNNIYHSYESVADFKESVDLDEYSDCYILLKGSRSLGLENILDNRLLSS